MTASTPRLRMFAGPNGSGKSTINEVLPPQLLGKDRDGNEVNLAAHRGKVVIVTFWASWCGYCLKELPVLDRLPRRGREVWLTIDDGPSADTVAILDALDRHGAHATFFLVGERAQARPDLVGEIRRRGHGIGNHTQTHPSARFWGLGPRAMAREVGQAQQALAGLAGEAPRWFRSVAGHTNPFLAAPLRAHGLARVAWSARGYDAVDGDPLRVLQRIGRGLRPGAIVLLHEGAAHGRSVEIVEAALCLLAERGFGTVEPPQ